MKHILSADSGFLSKRIGNGMKYVLQGLELARGSQTKKYSWMQQQNYAYQCLVSLFHR